MCVDLTAWNTDVSYIWSLLIQTKPVESREKKEEEEEEEKKKKKEKKERKKEKKKENLTLLPSVVESTLQLLCPE